MWQKSWFYWTNQLQSLRRKLARRTSRLVFEKCNFNKYFLKLRCFFEWILINNEKRKVKLLIVLQYIFFILNTYINVKKLFYLCCWLSFLLLTNLWMGRASLYYLISPEKKFYQVNVFEEVGLRKVREWESVWIVFN